MSKLEFLTVRPHSKALEDDFNKRELLSDFSVRDEHGAIWYVPVGTISDGKSVPESLEIIIGDPFEGVTEVAAWVHDYYCVTKLRSQKDTHRIFRELVLYDMKRNSEYGWIRYPWNLHNSKVWQYNRAWMMWAAVRAWNRLKNPEWK